MKCVLFMAALAAIAVPAVAAHAGMSVGDPGFYGSIDIGGFPQPQLIYPQPIIIEPVPPGVGRGPIYLHVPPGHAKHWSKHCHKYNACGEPVYFVQDRWYQQEYLPRYREIHKGEPGAGHGNGGNDHGKGNGHAKSHKED